MKNSSVHFQWIMAVLLGTAITSCNSNDDGLQAGIEIPGITIDGDADCCSAEEALNVYNYLSGLVEIPSLATEVEGKYMVQVYTKTGRNCIRAITTSISWRRRNKRATTLNILM